MCPWAISIVFKLKCLFWVFPPGLAGRRAPSQLLPPASLESHKVALMGVSSSLMSWLPFSPAASHLGAFCMTGEMRLVQRRLFNPRKSRSSIWLSVPKPSLVNNVSLPDAASQASPGVLFCHALGSLFLRPYQGCHGTSATARAWWNCAPIPFSRRGMEGQTGKQLWQEQAHLLVLDFAPLPYWLPVCK